MFKYQRLWFKKQHLARGENCTITYNVPGCFPVKKTGHGKCTYPVRRKGKTTKLHKESNSIVILHLKK